MADPLNGSVTNPHTGADPVIYKRWNDGFLVRSMTRHDAKIVQQWYNDICPTSIDLDIALDICDSVPGSFFFIGELKGEVIASIANVPVTDDARLQYCSYFYVAEPYRKYGYGRRLNDEVAAAAVGNAVLSLDSHDELEEMQKRRGCITAFKVTLYEGEVQPTEKRRSTAETERLTASASSNGLLHTYDDQCFIRPGNQLRRKLLERWTTIPGGETVVAYEGRGSGGGRRLVGFGCRRPSFQNANHLIGPLYADNVDIAWDIVAALSRDIRGQKIWINICVPNTDAVRLVNDLHLKENLHMIRMNKNGDPGPISNRVFAITSIDICGF